MDVFDDPSVKHLELVSVQEPNGLGPVRQPAPMWSFSGAATAVTTSINNTGGDSRQILADHGLSGEEIDQLVADGIVVVTDGSAGR
jgi:crotonobetainyl-CoA:carnitine CoA-transferase CaiB-like acyl-CoA transferase